MKQISHCTCCPSEDIQCSGPRYSTSVFFQHRGCCFPFCCFAAAATAAPSLPLLTALLRYNLHTIQSIYFKCTIQLLVVNLQNYATIIEIQFQNISITNKIPHAHCDQSNPIPTALPSNHKSVSIDLPFWTFHINDIRQYVVFCV